MVGRWLQTLKQAITLFYRTFIENVPSRAHIAGLLTNTEGLIGGLADLILSRFNEETVGWVNAGPLKLLELWVLECLDQRTLLLSFMRACPLIDSWIVEGLI